MNTVKYACRVSIFDTTMKSTRGTQPHDSEVTDFPSQAVADNEHSRGSCNFVCEYERKQNAIGELKNGY